MTREQQVRLWDALLWPRRAETSATPASRGRSPMTGAENMSSCNGPNGEAP